MKNGIFFEPESWLKDIYCLLKSSSFEIFDDGKYGLFLSQEVDGKDDIYWLRKSSCFQRFGGGKYGLFWVKKWMQRLYLLVTKKFLFWTFRGWEIWSFFHPQPRSWWKDDIYWLPRSSCFELLGDGKYDLFSAKKLMERWNLLGLTSFPWYSKTWEIRFFMQC